MSVDVPTVAPSRMDPRVAARRRALAGERMHRRRRVVLAVLVVCAVLVAAVGVWFTPLFDVDRVEVRGNTVLTDADIRRASGIRIGEPTVLVRPGRVDRRVEALPYVASARVKRVFPATVIITVRERVDALWVANPDGTVAVLDETGRVLRTADTPPPGLPRVDGLEDVPAPGGRVRDAAGPGVLALLPPGLRSLVTTVVVDTDGISLVLIGDLVVRLGDAADVAAKGAVAEAVIARSEPGTRVVDVRVPTSPVSR